ncbi:MAG TPA: 5-amino-6-(D-ribitylamino)uracil--L-tyrosine 4-hydroxyphenyl transferase CofH, partial [Steroidobacteraceae bacterium]|nr:5-amino-6-(D-ribitylamino)uracil--L-tyrosine 4-hydroxyphenyl transferase CofH [Steroidobacteraceae bacterium]
FAKAPRELASPYLPAEEALRIAQQGREAGCKEALFTLGDRPELRYPAARRALAALGVESTLEYLYSVAKRVAADTGLLPHVNCGVLSESELTTLRTVAPSMGVMLESGAERLTARGQPHHGSPDKHPRVRWQTLVAAGRAQVPLTTGLLVGIGETREERWHDLVGLKRLHDEYGHLQEILIQNFLPKPGTRMAGAPAPPFEELLWTVAVARLVFGARMSIQAPPNLNAGRLGALIDAGISDWGGISPVTRDHVNPEAPWPHLGELRVATAARGRVLTERLTVYPAFVRERACWIDAGLHARVLALADSEGYARGDAWEAGVSLVPPHEERAMTQPHRRWRRLDAVLSRAMRGERLGEGDVVQLFAARGDAAEPVYAAADALRREVNGQTVSFVVNRNINYTNICVYHCGFCAFSKGRSAKSLRGPAYQLDLEEIARRAAEAQGRGATELCLQGGIHPEFTGETYLEICRTALAAAPGIHIHAFSPLEVLHGAMTLEMSLDAFLARLQAAGLRSLPGTAAEILDDEVRAQICPDKLSTAEWLEVMRSAHRLGLRSTSTIMFGHLEEPRSWARHLLAIRDLQSETGGFTELVPLPFVHREAPLARRGWTRPGPTWREALLMHAVARLVLHPLVTNIQASWVKLGWEGAAACLDAGVNDLGGTLMNESISRAAGAVHGQERTADEMRALIASHGRVARQRTTLYGEV